MTVQAPARETRDATLFTPEAPVTPDAILSLGFAFWGSKVLLSAVELEVFTTLGLGARTGRQLEAALGLAPRATEDFLDALVALGMLAREGNGPTAL